MGLNIDAFIEKKNLETGLWGSHNPQYDDLGDLREIELDRSYLLYSMLGNWRNTRDIKPILEKNRTFPEDMSEELTERLAYDLDEPQNCLYLNEILNYDWDNQFVKNCGTCYRDIAKDFLNNVVSTMVQISETEEKNDVRIILVGC